MFVTRFAPSPTGHLHLGHAFSALTVFEAARAAGGRFLLRIEDSDRVRCKPEFEVAILEDLAWLGIEWEMPFRRQSEHIDEYQVPLQRLIDRGLVYPNFSTRREAMIYSLAHAPHEAEPRFFGEILPAAEEAERIARGEVFAWRFSTARAREILGDRPLAYEDETGEHIADPAHLGDVIIARKDFPASYHLASVWDDALQGVTHVIRGEDLRDSLHIHVTLRALLDLPPVIYRHHRLITDASGRRLAKRDKDVSLANLRAQGISPREIRRVVGLE
jgi:glutamyl-Q tRNA(Asp) synthetase